MNEALSWLTDRLRQNHDQPALLGHHATVTYRDLGLAEADTEAALRDLAVEPGSVVLFDAETTAPSLALFLALLQRGAIAVPFTRSSVTTRDTAATLTGATHDFRADPATGTMIGSPRNPSTAPHPHLTHLAAEAMGGLIIFTSGSTGTPKASLHRADRFLKKYITPRPALRTLLVLPLDHMAGLDSLLYTLSSGGAVIFPRSERPEDICAAIQDLHAELLPATPSLLNVMLLSGAFTAHDCSSLRMITYGAEVMPPATLARLRELLPHCRLIQKYGTTEFGSPSTRSREDGSLWFRIHGEGFETKVVDNILWVRSESSMVGYLNAEDPFEADGWINTGDQVETDGEYFRILGRKSEIINVGGQKIHPSDVEQVLLQMDNIQDATVRGEDNPLLGKTVTATVRLLAPEPLTSLRNRIRSFCRDKLPREAIPVRIAIADETLWNARFKKNRSASTESPS